MTAFQSGETAWISRLGKLRNVVRQEVVAEQLAEHAQPGWSVLDVGCGQGTQSVRLALHGCRVTALDPSPRLLDLLSVTAGEAEVGVESLAGDVHDLDRLLGDRRFDLVCAHGLLMYVDDADAVVRALVARMDRGGLLSLTFRNASAMAYRPALRRDWDTALQAFDATSYVNELGVSAAAHHLGDLQALLGSLGLRTTAWYGVRVFTDPAPADEPIDPDTIARVLRVEAEAGRRDPYRHLASQIHLIAQSR